MKKKLLLILMLCTMSLVVSKTSKAELFGLSGYTLNNGMRLIVIPNHKAPIAKHMLWYKVGAADEKIGKGGSAHLLEHLMFRGTKKIKGQDFNRIMEENGADSNAFTSQDMTVYHQFIDISRLELAMFLEADRMKNLTIDNKSFETERQIVFQERKQVVENNPLYRFNEAVQRAFWQTHPYSRPITGTEEEILKLKIKDVKSIYKKYYNPNNAILVIAGNIEPDVAYKLAEKYYGAIPPQGKANNKLPAENVGQTSISLSMKLPDIEISRVLRKYAAPSYNSGKEQIYAYMVLSKYLGEGETSKLYDNLVVQRKIATTISTGYNYTSLGGGSFTISATPAKGVTVNALLREIDDAVTSALKNLNNQELERVKTQMLTGLVYVKDNPQDAAQIVGMLALAGMSDAEIENYADNINQVSLADVKNAAMMLQKPAQVEGIVEPEGDKR